MTGRRAAGLAILSIALGLVGYQGYKSIPWIDVAAHVHSQRGTIECGYVVVPAAAQAAITCAISAHEHHQPFTVIFTVYGIDEIISNAVVGDSRGGASEIVYATGMVSHPNTLLRRRCDLPVQLQVEPPTVYPIPRLHCAPLSNAAFERDRLLW